jgi:hypothetical protein
LLDAQNGDVVLLSILSNLHIFIFLLPSSFSLEVPCPEEELPQQLLLVVQKENLTNADQML